MVPTADIHPNDYNPNVVPDDIMHTLDGDIERNGIKQPVLLRLPDRTTEEEKDFKGKYIIVDGQHRWLIATNKGISDIPCDLDENMTRHEAMIMTITMNKLRGEFDNLKLAEVLKTLQETYTADELEERLGYNQVELQSYSELLDFDFDSLKTSDEELKAMEDAANAANLNLPNEFLMTLSLEQLEIIEAAIAHAQEDGSREDSLTHICEMFLKNNGQQSTLDDIKNRLKELKEEVVTIGPVVLEESTEQESSSEPKTPEQAKEEEK